MGYARRTEFVYGMYHEEAERLDAARGGTGYRLQTTGCGPSWAKAD